MKNNLFKKLLTLFTSAGIIAGSLFMPPEDIKDDLFIIEEDKNRALTREAIDIPLEHIDETIYIEEEKKKRNWVLFSAALPFFFLGEFLTTLLTGNLSPAFAVLLNWVLGIVVLLITIIMIIKALFPDKSLKEILSKKTIRNTIIGTSILAIGDLCLTLFWTKYTIYKKAVVLIGALSLLIIIIRPFLKKK